MNEKLKPAEQHITRALYFPQGSVNTFVQYTPACAWHLLQIKKKYTKEISPFAVGENQNEGVYRKTTDFKISKYWYGLALSHTQRCWFAWQQQTMAHEAKKT